jgi:hypothetical protein
MSSSNTNPQTKVPAREPQSIIYSLCIPRVFKNISEKRIRAIFYSLKLGFVERVDMVAKSGKDGKEFWRVFVHFSQWNDRNTTATQFKAKLERGEQVKIVYDQPWFWMISKSYSQPPEQRSQSGRPSPSPRRRRRRLSRPLSRRWPTRPPPRPLPTSPPTDRSGPRSVATRAR